MQQQTRPKRFLVLQVITPHYHSDDAIRNMEETESLIKTFGGDVIHKEIQHRVSPHPATYIGSGKMANLLELVKEKKIQVVLLNEVVKSGQLFRVEKALWEADPLIQVWDRVGLILNIFKQHASTTESKLQIELAQILHEGPRMYGLGKDRLSRQGGGIGTRGAGETNIEKERRVIKERVAKIKAELKKLHKRKQHQIRFRKEQGLGPVALVGYTSAGKTTLFNALTGKEKKEHSKLFTTLDTVVGKMKTSDTSQPVIVSDTIGFIQNLPPMLIEAFRSTLLESLEAQLILHIIDAGDEAMLEKIEVVDRILEDLDVTQPVLKVFNKSDTMTQQRQIQIQRFFKDEDYFIVSATTYQGLNELKNKIHQELLTMNTTR